MKPGFLFSLLASTAMIVNSLGDVSTRTLPYTHCNSKGAAYNKAADKRSWTMMKAFFDEIFGN